MSERNPPVNFFSGSPLNRLSWLRSSEPFLNAIVQSPESRWIVFRQGQLLLSSHPETRKRTLARLTTANVAPLLGPGPIFSQGQKEGELADPADKHLETARLRGPGIVFLGLHETDPANAEALPSSDFSKKGNAKEIVAKIKGTPWFSLDVSDVEEKRVEEVLQSTEEAKSGAVLSFIDGRSSMGNLDYFEAGIFAEARAMVDWNARNKFCAACGSPVYSVWAGWKLACTSLLPWVDNSNRKPCPTASGLHNQSHPRTDPAVIMAVVNETGDKVFLGRNRKWPGRFYSALAGFVEPGESFEDAVARELWEEAGLKVWDVQYHSTQPWPFPANLMIGFYAIADSSLPGRIDLDNELVDARWYTREEILAVLAHPNGTKIGSRNPEKPEESSKAGNLAGDATANSKGSHASSTLQSKPATSEDPPFTLPPLSAIAGVLVSDWAHGKVELKGVGKKGLKGSL